MEHSGNHDYSIGRREIFSDTAVYEQRKRGKAESGARHFLEAAGKASTFTVDRRVYSEVDVREEKVQVDMEPSTSGSASQLSDSEELQNQKTM